MVDQAVIKKNVTGLHYSEVLLMAWKEHKVTNSKQQHKNSYDNSTSITILMTLEALWINAIKPFLDTKDGFQTTGVKPEID